MKQFIRLAFTAALISSCENSTEAKDDSLGNEDVISRKVHEKPLQEQYVIQETVNVDKPPAKQQVQSHSQIVYGLRPTYHYPRNNSKTYYLRKVKHQPVKRLRRSKQSRIRPRR